MSPGQRRAAGQPCTGNPNSHPAAVSDQATGRPRQRAPYDWFGEQARRWRASSSSTPSGGTGCVVTRWVAGKLLAPFIGCRGRPWISCSAPEKRVDDAAEHGRWGRGAALGPAMVRTMSPAGKTSWIRDTRSPEVAQIDDDSGDAVRHPSWRSDRRRLCLACRCRPPAWWVQTCAFLGMGRRSGRPPGVRVWEGSRRVRWCPAGRGTA